MFESEEKFHKALRYLCERYAGFKAKDLKHVLGITCPDFMDGLFERKEFACDLRYIGNSSAKFTREEIYESKTFNGATYEVIDNSGNLTMIGSSYFIRCCDRESEK